MENGRSGWESVGSGMGIVYPTPLARETRIWHNRPMRLLDLTLPTAAENLALDEALLESAEAAAQPTDVLRLWEPDGPMVVLGRSSKIDEEVDRDACRELNIPILRRTSGGLTILTGPGCLMYALVLSLERRPELRAVEHAHRFVLGTHAAALSAHVPGVRCQGTSDLAVDDGTSPPRKFSGNSIRVKRTHLLYHGTILYDFPLDRIERCLRTPPRMPDYRNARPHTSFLTNLPLPPQTIRQSLITTWDTTEPLQDWPRDRTKQLVAERYRSALPTERR